MNVATSSIAREADHILDIDAGPEIGVASTKAFTGQLLALLGLALKAGVEKAGLEEQTLKPLLQELVSLPRIVSEAIGCEGPIRDLAAELAPAKAAIFLGRGINHPIALEAALKLKEISYIHATGYAAGELKHGPIALIERDMPVIVFDNTDALQEKTMSNAAEVAARGARLWHVGQGTHASLRTPDCGASRSYAGNWVTGFERVAYRGGC